MKIEVLADADAVAKAAAAVIAADARAAVAARGRFVFAVSGGTTPWVMLRALAAEDMPWHAVHVFQVDERVAPAGDPIATSPTCRRACAHAPLSLRSIHAMPVEAADLDAAAARYAAAAARARRHAAGARPRPPRPRPGRPHRVAGAGRSGARCHRRRRRAHHGALPGPAPDDAHLPVLDRARRVLWLVTGAEKVGMLARLRAGDRSIPAGRVRADNALVLADRAASPQS